MKLIDILKEAIGSKYSPENFKLIKKGRGEETYLLTDEDYTTSSGLKFNLKTFGSKIPKDNVFAYIGTDVYYKGKKLTSGSGITGLVKYGDYDVAGSINKAKRWLDKNGDAFAQGKKQFIIPST
jgi:hypothetical protein